MSGALGVTGQRNRQETPVERRMALIAEDVDRCPFVTKVGDDRYTIGVVPDSFGSI